MFSTAQSVLYTEWKLKARDVQVVDEFLGNMLLSCGSSLQDLFEVQLKDFQMKLN